MRSSTPLALARLSIPAFMLLSLGACAGIRYMPTTPDALACSELIPDSYRQPVQGAPLPGPTSGEISAALDNQTSRLDRANGRTADVISIVSVCDKHNAAAVAKLKPKPWWRPFG